MKRQKQKFQIGDIIKNPRNNFQRIIRRVGYLERGAILKVMYSYSDEELNDLKPTGHFMDSVTGECSQDHLLNWQRGR